MDASVHFNVISIMNRGTTPGDSEKSGCFMFYRVMDPSLHHASFRMTHFSYSYICNILFVGAINSFMPVEAHFCA
jgi:hypothetical protein